MRKSLLSPVFTLSLLLGLSAFLWSGCGGDAKPDAPKDPAAAPESNDDSTDDDASDEQAASGYELKIPVGLEDVEMTIPEDNPMTAAKVELGKLLYFDPRLSKSGEISCATCHDPQLGWAERKTVSEGIGGQFGSRNAPTVINAAFAPNQFWDGRVKTLEEQALGPIENPIEMGHEMTVLLEQLKQVPEYQEKFQDVFGDEGITDINVGKAIAAFERTVLSGNSAYDKYMAGDKSALTDQQINGLALFEDNCSFCHKPPRFSNYQFINTGIGMDAEEPDVGRMDFTEKDRDRGAFRTPMLRDVADTAPYFHDGSAPDLKTAVGVMAQGGVKGVKGVSPFMSALAEAEISDAEQADIVAFLESLSGDYPRTEPPQLP